VLSSGLKLGGDALLIFLRYPEAGKVKTRLAADIGPRRAAEVYERLLRRTLGVVREFKRNTPATRIVLFHTPDDPVEKLMARFRGPWEFRPQEGEHLGMRMSNALRSAFADGADKAVLIGTDLVDVEAADIKRAFENIGEKVVVLGPAADGGFYLIGADRPVDSALDFDEWGACGVFSRTARGLAACGFKIHRTAERNDVDCVRDLRLLERDPLFTDSLSVIVPTLTDHRRLSPLLVHLENALWPGDEIIVVRGGAFEKIALDRISHVLTVVCAAKGRGIQQNIGAMVSNGTILFFLHDDTIPAADFPYLIRKACRDKPASLGCFKLRFMPSGHALQLIAAWANLRTALFGLPYGDQGLFCKKELFEKAGGFGRSYLMEDVELVCKLRKTGRSGRTISFLPVPVFSSSERYCRKGVLKASLQNHLLLLLSALGRDDGMLYEKYYGSEPPQ
jgi:hypothetical protein